MSANDTRSIGQVLYESETLCSTAGAWREVHPAQRERFERAAEVIFKRGHDARSKEERALTPKAKQYRDALKDALEAMGHVARGIDAEHRPGTASANFPDLFAAIIKAEELLR